MNASRASDGFVSPDFAGSSYGLSAELETFVHGPRAKGEAVRVLAAKLMAQQVDMGRRGLVVCGASPGVGVTYVATFLAIALAEAGVSTLLVDANLRAPGVQQLIVPSHPGAGLREMLGPSSVDLAEGICSEVLENLSVVYAGGAARDAAELVGSPMFKDFIERCLRDFEFTIIDAPPANQCADALAISAAVGYSLIIARRNLSFVEDIAALSEQLRLNGASVVGAILNGAGPPP